VTARRWLWRVALLGVVTALGALLVSGTWQLVAGGVTGSPPGGAPPCPLGRDVPIMDSPHVSQHAITGVQYTSTPPTSGPHFSFTVATGAYSSPVPDGLTVHALEHGHVAILYRPDAPEGVRRTLGAIARRHSTDVVLAPYPGLRPTVALAAWGCLDELDATAATAAADTTDATAALDAGRVTAFVEALADRYHHGWRG